MSFRRALAINVAVQSIGAALSFILAIGITFFWGAGAQGEFALIKSWVEFGSLLALAGMPQGFVFAINRKGASPSVLGKFSGRYCLFALPAAALVAAVTIRLGYFPHVPFVEGIVVLAIAVAGYTYHGLIRSILLTASDGLAFSLFSIAPVVLVAIGVLVGLGGSAPDFLLVYLVASVVATGLSLAVTRSLAGDAATTVRLETWMLIARQSIHSFVVSVLGSAQVVVLFSIMQFSGAGLNEVGLISVALLVANAVNVLCTMISPVLYNRWSKAEMAGKTNSLSIKIGAISVAAAVVLSAFAVAALMMGIGMGIGLAAQIWTPVLILCVSLPAVLYARLIIPAVFSVGQPGAVTVASVVRVLLIGPALIVSLSAGLTMVPAAAAAFTVAETVGAIIVSLVILLRHAPIGHIDITGAGNA
jgi:hypothetical protein